MNIVSKANTRISQKKLLRNIINKKKKDHLIIEQLIPLIESSFCVGLYYPLKDEPDLLQITNIYPRIKFFFPKIIENEQIEFILPHSFDLGRYGVKEPYGNEMINPIDFDRVILPGLGFSAGGFRLGRGKGYYDRSLKHLPFNKIIGVTYSEVFPAVFQEEAHDIRCSTILTEEKAFFLLDENEEPDIK